LNKEIVDDLIFAVEQQIESTETKYVKDVYDTILKKGILENEAKLMIGRALLMEIDYIHSKGGEFSQERYKNYLKELLEQVEDNCGK
jgi:polyhydroxyalkanoate synthesis regulator phasin